MDHVIFSVGTNDCAVPLEFVKEVQPVLKIQTMPGSPSSIDGLVSIRSHSVAVVDLRKRFCVEPEMRSHAPKVIVVAHQGMVFGLIVDVMHGIQDINVAKTDATPLVLGENLGERFIKGIAHYGERSIMLVDVTVFLNTKDLSQLEHS